MPTITAVSSGGFGVASNWDTNTVPSSIDTIVINAGVTIDITDARSFASGTLSGELSVKSGGSADWTGQLTISAGVLSAEPGATIDYAEGSIKSSGAGSALTLVGNSSNPVVINGNTTNIGGIGRVEDDDGFYGKITAQYVVFNGAGRIRLGRNYSQGFLVVENCIFYYCGDSKFGDYANYSGDWIIRNNDFYGTVAPSSLPAVLFRKLPGIGTPGTGTVDISNNNFEMFPDSGLSYSIRFEGSDLDLVENFAYINCITVYVGNGDAVVESDSFRGWNAYSGLSGLESGGGTKSGDVIFTDTNNPKIVGTSDRAYIDCVIHNHYQGAIAAGEFNDLGDMCPLYNVNISSLAFTRNVIIEEGGGAVINALYQNTFSRVVNCSNNTMIFKTGLIPEYGNLFRTESGGYSNFMTVSLDNNIVYNSGDPASLAININGAANTGDIENLRTNVFYGYNTPYSNPALYPGNYDITHPTKTFGDTDYGGSDLQVNPMFLSPIAANGTGRDPLKYIQSIGGTADTASLFDYVRRRNGFNPTTVRQEAGNASGLSVVAMRDWVREGYQVQNQLLENAGHDGTTIGAMGYIAATVENDTGKRKKRKRRSRLNFYYYADDWKKLNS